MMFNDLHVVGNKKMKYISFLFVFIYINMAQDCPIQYNVINK